MKRKTRFACLLLAMMLLLFSTPAAAADSGAGSSDYSKEIEAMSKWLDSLTLTPSPGTTTPENSTGAGAATGSQSSITQDELQAYAAKVYEIVNEERDKAGLSPVVWDDEFAACAQIRAVELQYLYSHTRPVQPEDATKVWPENTNGKGVYNAPSVADEQGVAHAWIMENIVVQRDTPEAAMAAWMNSAGHRNNILKESHVRCGVGVYHTNEETPTGFQWFWVIWFDSYEA